MKNQKEGKIVCGLVISGLVGAGILYLLKAARHRPTPVLKKIGNTITEVGEALKHCNMDSIRDAVHHAEAKAPSPSEMISNLMDWASTGLSIWKKFNR